MLFWVALLSFNGIPLANVPAVALFVTALALLDVGAGIGISLAVPDRQRAQLLYSLGVLGAFAAAAFLPEPPVTTAARLAIGSPAQATLPMVVGFAVLALLTLIALRAFVQRTGPETF